MTSSSAVRSWATGGVSRRLSPALIFQISGVIRASSRVPRYFRSSHIFWKQLLLFKSWLCSAFIDQVVCILSQDFERMYTREIGERDRSVLGKEISKRKRVFMQASDSLTFCTLA